MAAELSGTHALYFHADRLGTVRKVTDETGQVVDSLQYSAFGVLRNAGTAAHGAFTGHRWNVALQCYDYGKRFYDPLVGQFISPDPNFGVASGEINAYTYAKNNPLRFIDPDGAQWGVATDGSSGPGSFPSGWSLYPSDPHWAGSLLPGSNGFGGIAGSGSGLNGFGTEFGAGTNFAGATGIGSLSSEANVKGQIAGPSFAGNPVSARDDGIERSYLDPISLVVGGASFYGAKAVLSVIGAASLGTSAGAGSDLAFPDVAINTAHAAPHMIEEGLTHLTLQIESAIDRDVTVQWSNGLIKANTTVFDIDFDGIPIRYHANSTSENLIRVGTYFVP
jgi:RHS repeat-associated protein